MQLQQKFQALFDRLDPNSPASGEELRALLAQYPMEFRTWAVAWIRNGGRGPRAHLLLRLLHQKNMLRSLLVNAGAIPLRDAVRIARLAQHSIANLDRIVADTIRDGTVAQATRALQVLHHVPLTGRVVPGLAAALQNTNPKIRSLVSKLLGRICDDPASIHTLLRDRDARVRANTVEGFWGSTHPLARDLMRRCLTDPDNRVAANAALGLFKIGDPDGIEALRIMSAHPDHRHRISATWGIVQTRGPALLPALEALAADRIPKVREAAQTALARMRNPVELQRERSLVVRVSQAYRMSDEGLRLRAWVGDLDENPLEDLSAGSFRVFQGELQLTQRQVQLPAQADRLITVLWLVEGTLPPAVCAKAHDAIVGAMRHRKRRDLHCLVGPDLRAALAFSSDIGQLDDALHQAAALETAKPAERPASGWSERLFRALALASSRPGCRAAVAFSNGVPLEAAVDVSRLTQHALDGEIAIHVVAYRPQPESEAEWQRIASTTQGSYRAAGEEDELQHAFWCVFSQLASSYAISVRGVCGDDGAFRLQVESSAEYGETAFEAAPQPAGDRLSTPGVHVK